MKNLFLIVVFLFLISCKSTSPNMFIKEQDGVILIGFILNSMNNKENLSDDSERILSITLKNVDSGDAYHIDLTKRNFGIKKVKPGVYCLKSVRTYVNLSLSLKCAGNIAVNSGQIVNAGYWISGIEYDNGEVKFRVFDTNTRKLNLFEQAGKYYSNYLEEKFSENYKINDPSSIVGFWYAADDLEPVYFFDIDGSYYSFNALDNGSLTLKGNWSMINNQGSARLKNGYGSTKLRLSQGKLYGIYENIKGSGIQWVAYRNPIRNWKITNEYASSIVRYNRSTLEEVSKNENKSIFVRIIFDTKESTWPERVGKRALKRPEEQQIIESNVSKENEALIISKFYKWRFVDTKKAQTITICVINKTYPEECTSTSNDIITFKLNNQYPENGFTVFRNM